VGRFRLGKKRLENSAPRLDRPAEIRAYLYECRQHCIEDLKMCAQSRGDRRGFSKDFILETAVENFRRDEQNT